MANDSQNQSEKTLGPVLDVGSTTHPLTLSQGVTRRAPRVGLKGSRGHHYTLAQLLDARTIKGPSCWNVQGHALPNGYVLIGSHPNRALAHRLAYTLTHGRIPAGMVVMHSCDNPRCVNPDHLSAGTQRQNIHDSIRKGRYNVFGIQKLNAAQVREIRAAARSGEMHKTIAKRFGIARNTVSGIVSRAAWAHLTEHAALEPIFERVQHVDLPIRGDLHV